MNRRKIKDDTSLKKDKNNKSTSFYKMRKNLSLEESFCNRVLSFSKDMIYRYKN